MAVVKLDGLTKIYERGQPPAAEDVSLEIADGEFMVLLGPSGCGKTTTLRMIAGLESISAGTLSIDGTVVNKVPAKDRDIAMVFQSYALYPHMSVADNLAFGLRRRRFDRAEISRRITEAADILGLTPYLTRRPHALSGGQRQRVALGRAIVRDPKVFLFDEPLSNLDAALRVSTRGEIAALHRRLGATMIYVTHDQVEAMTLGTRICIMSGGRIAQVGSPLEVYHRPHTTFVASFLGNPPMNLLPAKIEDGVVRSGDLRIIPPPDRVRLAGSGDDCTFGIRPEHLDLQPNLGPTHLSITGEVTQVEALGAETMIAIRPDGQETPLIARVNGTPPVRPGSIETVYADLSEMHLFDQSGQSLVRFPEESPNG